MDARDRYTSTVPISPASLRPIAAEFVGSAGLAAVVVGSGIAAQQLSPTDVGLQLLENALVTALGLGVLIVVFVSASGAHFNPVVTLADVVLGRRSWGSVAGYIPAQVFGCIVGVILANLMFGASAVSWSTTDRMSPPHFLAEIVATAGLVFVIFALARTDRIAVIPVAVGSYIGAAYFFTSSTSFANPAITIGRMFSDSFAGIAPSSAPGYIAAQLLGAALGVVAVRALYPRPAAPAAPAAPSPVE